MPLFCIFPSPWDSIMSHDVSLAGPLLSRPWTLKSRRLLTDPMAFLVSHCPKVLGKCLQPTTLASFLLPPSQAYASRGTNTYTQHLWFPSLSALAGRLQVPGGMPCSHHVSPKMHRDSQGHPTLAYLIYSVTECQCVPPLWRESAG